MICECVVCQAATINPATVGAVRGRKGQKMEQATKIMNLNLSDIKPGQVVPLRSYVPRTVEELRAVLADESSVGKGKALVRVNVTAQLAGELIEFCNHGNRPIKAPNLAAYMAAMRDKRWGDSSLILGLVDGSLCVGDGQHRLRAQQETGTTQAYGMWVYSDPDDFKAAVRYVDARGAARNVRDLLVIEGLMSAGHAQYAEGALNTMVWFDGTQQRGVALDLDTRMNLAERRAKSLAYVASDIPPRTFRPWVLGALAFAYAKDPKATAAMVAAATAAEGLQAGNAAHTFALMKETLNGAKKPSEKRRAMAATLRLVSDYANKRKTAKNVATQCDPTYEAVRRYAGDRAVDLLKADKGV